MNEETFLNTRKTSWLRLMELCDLADRSPTDLNRTQLKELFRLYRGISTDLSVARTIATSPSLITYLNDLTARAYAVVYRQPRESFKKIIVNAVRLSAQTVRRRRAFVYASILLFFGSAILTFLLTHFSPSVHSYFMDQMGGANFDSWRTGNFEERNGSMSTMMAGFYASNNPRVAIVMGSIGAGTFGLLSTLMIFQNGAIMGVLTNEMVPVHRVDYFLTSVSPHSVPELSGLFFSGACGLLLGWSLLNPGKLSRGESLKAAGKDAITLLATSVVMMFIAAPIEGFFSFNPHVPGWLKVVVATSSLSIWLYFWNTFGRDTDPVISADDPVAE